MPDPDPIPHPSALHWRALSRWENEGGATASAVDSTLTEVPDLTNAELVQLRVRVIALENLIIAVLAEGSDRQLQIARDMGDYISPRPDFTHHSSHDSGSQTHDRPRRARRPTPKRAAVKKVSATYASRLLFQ